MDDPNKVLIFTFTDRQAIIVIDGIKQLVEKHAVGHLLRQSLGDRNWSESDDQCNINEEREELGKALLEATEETFDKKSLSKIIKEVAMPN